MQLASACPPDVVFAPMPLVLAAVSFLLFLLDQPCLIQRQFVALLWPPKGLRWPPLAKKGAVVSTLFVWRGAAPPAVWRGAAVLRRLWPPSPCRGAAPCGLRLVAGEGGWCCCCGAATHAARSVGACNRGPPSSASASTSGLSRPVLPRRL
jgi:hypothetical protein